MRIRMIHKAADLIGIGICSAIIFPSCGIKAKKSESAKPNIIVIMIDDLGFGDLGCYGSKYNQTANIDRLAENGLKFLNFHSNGSMSSPTRAAFLTGLYQNRLGIIFEGALGVKDYNTGMPLEAITIAEVLKEEGYATGMYGKWHLGYLPPYLPGNQGFDDFKGLVSGDLDHHTHVDRWGREDWWHNEVIESEDGYSVDLITNHSIQFINKNKNVPFFLYVAHIAIHFPWQGPDDPPHREAGKSYEADKWGIIPDRYNVQPHVKAMVESIDKGVGEIISTLKNLGLEENTLIVFTSDNGGYIDYQGLFHNISSNGPFRGQKGQLYEGGHRVPGIFYWPGRIERGTTNEVVLTMDLFPTFTSLASAKLPENLKLDGVDIQSLLLHGEQLPERTIFWKTRNDRALLKDNWKLLLQGERLPELYNLNDDNGETINLAKSNPEIVSELTNEYEGWYNDIISYASKWN